MPILLRLGRAEFFVVKKSQNHEDHEELSSRSHMIDQDAQRLEREGIGTRSPEAGRRPGGTALQSQIPCSGARHPTPKETIAPSKSNHWVAALPRRGFPVLRQGFEIHPGS